MSPFAPVRCQERNGSGTQCAYDVNTHPTRSHYNGGAQWMDAAHIAALDATYTDEFKCVWCKTSACAHGDVMCAEREYMGL